MGVIQYKIWNDLWQNKRRTMQMVLTIAIGALAVGMTLGASDLMRAGIQETWQSSSPAMISLELDPPIDQEMLDSLKSIPGVVTVEGEFMAPNIKWRQTPNDAWAAAHLIARDDYNDLKLNRLELRSGSWPARKQMAVETGYNLQEGDTIYLQINNKTVVGDRVRPVELSGVLFNQVLMPATYGGNPTFYTTRSHFAELTGQAGFGIVRVTAKTFDETEVADLANRIQDHLKKQDIESKGAGDIFGKAITNPNQHPFHESIDGLNFVLITMAFLSLLLGLLLIFTTMTALISQQTRQIGMMKAIGARSWQIMLVYLSHVLIYGGLALLLALPLGAIAAYGLYASFLSIFAIIPGPFQVSYTAVATQIIITLLAPILAAILPVITGVHLTVREAISSYGVGGTAGLLEHLLTRFQFIPLKLGLMISNTFRSKKRAMLTLLTLTGSGVIFMTVMSAEKSLNYTYDDLLQSIYRFDVALTFEDTQRINTVKDLTPTHPEVETTEVWAIDNVSIRPATQAKKSNQDKAAILFGVPLPTTLYGPELRAGRWLKPDDTYAVVLNQRLAKEAGINVGDWVTFDHGVKGESDWLVVGLVFDALIPQSAHVPRETLLRETDSVNKANTAVVRLTHHNSNSQTAELVSIKDYFEGHQMKVSTTSVFYDANTVQDIIKLASQDISMIVGLLGTMAVIMAIVGSIALSGVLSINVLERRREIGVMRAIGASTLTIARLFIGEGLTLGLISWLIALPLSIPTSWLMSQALGVIVMSQIVYQYSEIGVLFWLIIVIVLSIVASWLPARSATTISVRESLMYQ
ncbi:MAG: ABC transporter permease [Anaerolineae bacterium]|nr:ABC transporter permease [Anaerolineae bacterium]